LHFSADIIRVIRWAGYETRRGEMRNSYNVLVGKPEV
jgi:hypothetical protein